MIITLKNLVGVKLKGGFYLKSLFMIIIMVGIIYFTPYLQYSVSDHNTALQEIFVFIVIVAPYFIYGFLIFNLRWKLMILYILFYAILESIIITMAESFVIIINKKFLWHLSLEQEYLIASFIMIAFFVIMSGFFKKRNRIPFQNMRIRSFILIAILGYMDVNISAIIIVYLERQTSNYAYFISTIAVFFLMFQILEIIYLVDALTIWKERNQINQRYLKFQEEHYEILLEKDEDIRKFQHDMIHHMNILRNLYIEGNHEEMKAYEDKINLLIKPSEGIVYTSNKIVDSIVNHFVSEGNRLGIKINVSGRMPGNCYVDNFDLCTIFSNILSNAIEATKECQEKEIEIGIRYDELRIYIKEENPYIGQILQKENTLLSQKRDSKKHGIGLNNVKDSLKKYNGELLIDITQNKFKTMIILENK